jgi:hypothetical protein
MLRKMNSKYDGRCRNCKAPFSAGSEIYWSAQTKALCLKCGAGNKPETPATNPAIPTKAVKDKERFVIDYPELKRIIERKANGENVCKNSDNERLLDSHVNGCRTSFHGYTSEQLKRWLKSGYEAPGISGLGNFNPPIREKRRYRYNDDSGELHVDRAISGEDSFYGEWTKQERIPGANIEVNVGFLAGTKAEVVNGFNVFACRAVKALETAGIDCQVSFKISSQGAIYNSEWSHVVIRVKKENEAVDFRSFTPMLSPAAFRTFGFAGIILHAERNGTKASSGLGSGRAFNSPRPDWGVKYDSEQRKIILDSPPMPTFFPEEMLTNQFRKAVQDMRKNK